MVLRVLSGCLAGFWLCVLALGALPLTAEPAQAQSCRSLQSQLASARRVGGNRAEYRRYADAAKRQARELQRAERIYRSRSCSRSGARDCRSLGSTIRKMRSNLANLERVRDRSRGGASKREIRRLERAVHTACRPAQTRSASVRRHTGTRAKAPVRPRKTVPSPAPEPSFAGEHRTLCVRTCDGYFFPISFATHSGNFERDAAVCSALCPAAPTMLFTHLSGDDEGPQNMTALDGTRYAALSTAFSFQKKGRSPDCTCGRANTAQIGIEGVTPPSGEVSQSGSTGLALLQPLARPDSAADPETQMNARHGLTERRMVDIARSVSVGEVYDVADNRQKVRVVGGEFLPDPEEALDLTNPVPTPFP